VSSVHASRVEARAAGFRPAGSVATSADVPEIAGLLPDDSTAVIEYVTGAFGAPTTAFVVPRGEAPAQALVLPPADSLTGAIGRFIALVARGADDRAEA